MDILVVLVFYLLLLCLLGFFLSPLVAVVLFATKRRKGGIAALIACPIFLIASLGVGIADLVIGYFNWPT